MEDSLSRSMFRLQAVGDNKSPSLEDSDDGLRHKNSISRSCPGAPEQPGQDASRSRWSGTRAIAELPTSGVPGGTGGTRGTGGTPPSPGFELPAAAAEAGTSDEEEFHQQVSFSTVADENGR